VSSFAHVDIVFKMAHFMPTTTHKTTKGMTQLFYHVYNLHDLPKVVISDMIAKFTCRFWNVLHGLLRTRLVMSTSFHL
jgi:hypothetical protein